MIGNESRKVPLIATLDEAQPPLIVERDDSNAAAVVIYTGWASIGAKQSDPEWRIMKTTINKVGNVTTTSILYPDGRDTYEYKWSDRTTLTYAQ